MQDTEDTGPGTAADPSPGTANDAFDENLGRNAIEPTAGQVATDAETETGTGEKSRATGSRSGDAETERGTRTLPVGVELHRQLTRRRVRLALTFLAVLPVLLLLAFELGQSGEDPDRGSSLVELATASGLNFAVFTLYVSVSPLLVVVVALLFGDTVASEASWGSLRYVLATPVRRTRLLRQKATVSALLSGTGLFLIMAVSLAIGVLWYGSGPLLTPSGGVLSMPAGLLLLAAAGAYLALHLMWIAGLALLLSVSTDAPLGAVGGAVFIAILSRILDEITALGNWRSLLPTHYETAWTDLLADGTEWTAMANGAFSALAYATVFTAAALIRFHRKDITS